MEDAVPFKPSLDVAIVLNALLDRCEARSTHGLVAEDSGLRRTRAVKIHLDEIDLPGYFSQEDPDPRWVANRQLLDLEGVGWLRLSWLPGETGSLLDFVSMAPETAGPIYSLCGRVPAAGRRLRLESL